MKDKIQKILLVIFPFVLPLPIPEIYCSICLALFLVGLFFDFNFSFKSIKMNYFLLFSLLFFFADTIGNLLRFDFSTLFFKDTKLSFLIIPLLFLGKSNLLKKNSLLICNAFVFGSLSYVLYAWGYIADFYLITAPDYRTFSLTDGYIVYQLYNYLPGAIHHTYIGIYIVFSILILLNHIKQNRPRKYLNLVMIMILGFSLFYIGGKGSFLLLFLLVFLYLISLRKVVINILFVLSFFGGLYLVKRWVVGIRLENSISVRLDYYKCGWEILKENWFAGIGAKNFSEISALICNNDVFIPHNIYLRVFVANGILGLIILLGLIFVIAKDAFRKKDWVYISLIIMLILGGLTEDLIYRQQGVLFFIFFISLFYMSNKQSKV
ncbi:hypothetical protein BTO05_08555 [Winogradskyella sp. PC-19]|uniref:O-antigen ligase family protein n=1 Tax=Winogradskyella sp. PC-19 TaxID=754417 RepID=UPI000B3D062A|nr:O-antigen ligase family protein [Winogradskyella sp. PC-19]ARV09690.1 hypothetical protein BTO05_08555 [Winogradskyella sp. PC-19]